MFRLCILGAGRHSHHHGAAALEYCRQDPGRAEVAAVCDLDGEKAREYARRYEIPRTYDDFHRMLQAERPDGLIAVTPLAQTEPIAAALLEARVPFLMEKPPGCDAAATARLLALAQHTGTPHMVSFNRRFNPAVVAARQWLQKNAADSPPRAAVGRMLRHRRCEPNFAHDTGIHLIDMVLSFMGTPRRITTCRQELHTPEVYLFDAQLEFENAAATLLIAPDTGADEETCELYGENYYLRIDVNRAHCDIWHDRLQVLAWRPPADASRFYLEGTVAETAAFVESLSTGRFWPTLADGLVSMRAAAAVQKE
jgi:predicted dehydrogenase